MWRLSTLRITLSGNSSGWDDEVGALKRRTVGSFYRKDVSVPGNQRRVPKPLGKVGNGTWMGGLAAGPPARTGTGGANQTVTRGSRPWGRSFEGHRPLFRPKRVTADRFVREQSWVTYANTRVFARVTNPDGRGYG